MKLIGHTSYIFIPKLSSLHSFLKPKNSSLTSWAQLQTSACMEAIDFGMN